MTGYFKARVFLSVLVQALSVIAVAVHVSRATGGESWYWVSAVALALLLGVFNVTMWRTLYASYKNRRDLETVQSDQSPFHDN